MVMKILVADDNEDFRMIAKRTLESEGYSVETTFNGAKCLKLIEKSPPDIIISDIIIPEIDGLRLCHIIKNDKRFKNIPFIFCTANNLTSKDKKLAFSLGASHVIAKPINNEEFLLMIKNVLEKYKEGRLPNLKRSAEETHGLFTMYGDSLSRALDKKVQKYRLYRQIFTNSRDAIAILDINGFYIEYNKAYVHLLGTSERELKGQTPAIHLGQESFSEVLRVLSEKGFFRNELKSMTRSGDKLSIELSVFPIRDEKNEIFCYAEIIRDITGCKDAQEKIIQDYHIQRTINSILKISLLKISLKEQLEYTLDLLFTIPWLCFQSKGCIFLIEDDQLVMKAHRKLPHEVKRECKRLPLGRCLCGRAALNQKIQFANGMVNNHMNRKCPESLAPHGHYCVPIVFSGKTLGVLNMYLKPAYKYSETEDEFLTAVANTLAGIIQRTRTEEEKDKMQSMLHQAQKMEAIGTLAGGIAHDFNNILTAIIGYTEIALLDIPQNMNIHYNLNQVLNAANRAKELVRQILTFSRQSSLERKPIQIAPIVKEALKLLRASIPSTIEIRQNIQNSSGTIMANPSQIHQILMNLCINAAHAMREKGGVLEVSLIDLHIHSSTLQIYDNLAPGHYLKLTISDTGHGMDSEIIKRIFDPFFTTKIREEGTGMGLAVVHGIITSYDGSITVSSVLNEGTSFDILLPCLEQIITTQQEMYQIMPKGKGRILFVDDEEAIVNMVRQMLGHLGYEVIARTSCIDALDTFRSEASSFCLLITDQTMPQMTGIDLAQEFKRIRPDIPVILCTGFSELITPQEAKKLGIDELIMKPIITRDLVKTICCVLKSQEDKEDDPI
jgi:PAS domain S-box-containing protein